jgi:hypothetical protein
MECKVVPAGYYAAAIPIVVDTRQFRLIACNSQGLCGSCRSLSEGQSVWLSGVQERADKILRSRGLFLTEPSQDAPAVRKVSDAVTFRHFERRVSVAIDEPIEPEIYGERRVMLPCRRWRMKVDVSWNCEGGA